MRFAKGCISPYSGFGLGFYRCRCLFDLFGKNKNKALITFDDGLADVYRVAYPELKERGIPFTVFIITEFLDTEGYLTTDQLVELSKDSLVTVGSHGLSHDVLKGMPRERQEEELLKSKENLESLLCRPVKYFAYSHGQYDDVTLEILKNKRYYSFAFGVAGYPTNICTRRWKYHLPRLNCEDRKVPFRIEKYKENKKIIKTY